MSMTSFLLTLLLFSASLWDMRLFFLFSIKSFFNIVSILRTEFFIDDISSDILDVDFVFLVS